MWTVTRRLMKTGGAWDGPAEALSPVEDRDAACMLLASLHAGLREQMVHGSKLNGGPTFTELRKRDGSGVLYQIKAVPEQKAA